ncbi:putative 3-demethylubiquinone-9 3-methyltransferase (glyoxalase superfamily) [Nitrobacteraceae bacterium AZCC 1564]
MKDIVPCLWFDGRANEAVNFYTSIFKNAKIGHVAHYGDGMPMPKGSVLTIELEINGQKFLALNGPPVFTFTPALSLIVNCETQEEVDHFWEKLSEGGEKQQCGWVKDKFGLSWQVVPAVLSELMRQATPDKSQKLMNAVMQMTKLDIKALQQAYAQ